MSKWIYQDEHTRLLVLDDPDPDAGGACHDYVVIDRGAEEQAILNEIGFQHGPIVEAGINGMQHIHLLHAIRHRLECFQAGPFASDLNAECLAGVEAALAADMARTAGRQAAGVEGKNEPAPGVEMSRTHVSLEADQVDALRDLVASDGSSVSHHLRQAVRQYLAPKPIGPNEEIGNVQPQ